MKIIKQILSLFLLIILQFSLTNSLASVFSIEFFDNYKIEFPQTEKLISDFSEPSFKEYHIFESSFHNNVSCLSISCCADYAELVKAWRKLQNTSFSTEIKWLESFNALKKNDLLKYVGDISDAEATAIHQYTVSNSGLTNGAYRGTLTAKQQEWMDLVNSGLDKLRSTKGYKGKVFRGSNRPESEILERYVNVYNEGVSRGITPRVNEPPLLSTSKSADVAEYFISKGKRSDYVEVMFEMTSKRGVDIDDISDYGKYLGPKNHPDKLIQQEVILSNNQDYEILDVIKSTNNDGSIRYLIKLSE